jgi:Leucine-rich repeat (LRR) protein
MEKAEAKDVDVLVARVADDVSAYTFRTVETEHKLRHLKLQLSNDGAHGRRCKYKFKGRIENRYEQIPRELFLIRNLQVLDLSSDLTFVFDELPADIGKLSKLKSLHLDSNRISTLPDEIGRVESLDTLTLAYNRLVHLPASMGQLRNLKSLHLTSNRLVHMPKCLFELKALAFLDLSFNKIVEVPLEIGQLAASLETLILYRNFIKTLPESLCECARLQTLWLGSNLISELPKNFYKLKRLDWKENLMISSCIGDNPMCVPPMNVCEQGFTEIVRYLEKHHFP